MFYSSSFNQWLIVCFPGSGGASAAPAEKPAPEFIDQRIKLYDELKAQYLDELSKKPKNPIKVTLPDGKEVEATSWESTPYDVAKGISQGLADNTVIARVNNELWDLDRPLEVDCKLQLLKFDDPDAQAVFWHSSAHILGEAMEKVSSNLNWFILVKNVKIVGSKPFTEMIGTVKRDDLQHLSPL